MMDLAALAFAFAGFAALALAMDRHHRQVLQRACPSPTRVGLRIGGTVGLLLSLAACTTAWGCIGSVAWFGVLTAGAAAVVLLLTYAPRATAAGGLLCVPIGIGTALLELPSI